jgi:hypothetical protein
MVQDLRSRYPELLEGKSKPEVERLLGKPDPEDSGDYMNSYDVLPRDCRVNMCRFEVLFDEQTGKAYFLVLVGVEND